LEAKAEWELVMDDEIASLMENQMWDLIELPKSVPCITSGSTG